MNRLKIKQQATVISSLVEGNSIRSTERMTGIHRDTIMRLIISTGNNCETIMDKMMCDLSCKHIQVDEVWCYVGKKQRHITQFDDQSQVGDFWTWVAIDADSKLIPSYFVGKRDSIAAHIFINDLASRLKNRVQISSDALAAYVDAIDNAFGCEVDYGQIVKSYEAEAIGPGRYSPPKVTSLKKTRILGNPDLQKASTTYIERQNLTMRMSIRRFTRLTNAFSKKLENLKATIALHFAYYNFVRTHSSLRVTPAMEAGITDHFWTIQDLLTWAN